MTTRTVPDDRELTGAELIERVVALCHERKAEDVVVLDVRELVEYMDAMVICTGRSPRQNRAIAQHVMTQLKREHRILPLSKAGNDAGAWICVDFVDVVLHVFEPEARAHYDLELLWADSVRTEHEAPERPEDDTPEEEPFFGGVESPEAALDDAPEQDALEADGAQESAPDEVV